LVRGVIDVITAREKAMSPKAANSIDTYVAGRLRSYRKQLGISQAEIARELGVTFQQVQKYEAGINRIGAGRLFQLAALYGVSVLELFPKSVRTPDGIKKTEKLDEITGFAASADGWKLCEAFLRIKDPRQRKIIISLIQEMADD
jgi:transcriptional regulator with XRE-family HTH domain